MILQILFTKIEKYQFRAAATLPATTPTATRTRDERQGHREVMTGARARDSDCHVSSPWYIFLPFLLTTLTIYLGFQTMGPKRRLHRRLGPGYCNTHEHQHGHVTTPSHQHQA